MQPSMSMMNIQYLYATDTWAVEFMQGEADADARCHF